MPVPDVAGRSGADGFRVSGDVGAVRAGRVSYRSALLASQSLAAYAIGLPSVVLLKVLAPAAFARGDTALPVKIGMVTLAINFVLNVVFNAGALAPASIAGSLPLLKHVGPALATSVASTFNVLVLALALHRRGHLVADADLLRRLPRMGLAAAAMGVTLWFAEPPLFHYGRWFGLISLVTLGSRFTCWRPCCLGRSIGMRCYG